MAIEFICFWVQLFALFPLGFSIFIMCSLATIYAVDNLIEEFSVYR